MRLFARRKNKHEAALESSLRELLGLFDFWFPRWREEPSKFPSAHRALRLLRKEGRPS